MTSRYLRPPASPGRPLRVGVQLPEVERDVRWAEVLDLARRAEDVGLDSLWVGDHLLYRFADGSARGPWEAWTQLAALAAVTERVTLGPLVACTAYRNPAVLAKEAATLDEISGGRFVLGLGAGWNETEFTAYGLPFDRRVSRFEEAFTIVTTLLRDGAVDFAGQFYQARDCELVPLGPTAGGPPVLVGSIGARMLRITAPVADAWNAWYSDTHNEPAGVAPLRTLVDDAVVAAGRAPGDVARTVAVPVRMPGGTGRVMGDYAPSALVSPLTGSPEEVAAGLAAYAEAGIDEVQLVLDPVTGTSVDALRPVLEILDAR
ncbi:LLM class flavin-dependent oxidoreductase [Antribacter sp. KLBMP9083]|uniref:LLM class flavin-dependent oxidoreductase n=1 Tax=Antribacter soli TaxID=2910976 RepID=A0AA41QE74_9MICO|nr:LLM class flavin-dependent oxidoreductase [Antribacter soli]MCF4121522.1 LLM class flavin-dependent oxidoreductase [Antribacter soli]